MHATRVRDVKKYTNKKYSQRLMRSLFFSQSERILFNLLDSASFICNREGGWMYSENRKGTSPQLLSFYELLFSSLSRLAFNHRLRREISPADARENSPRKFRMRWRQLCLFVEACCVYPNGWNGWLCLCTSFSLNWKVIPFVSSFPPNFLFFLKK